MSENFCTRLGVLTRLNTNAMSWSLSPVNYCAFSQKKKKTDANEADGVIRNGDEVMVLYSYYTVLVFADHFKCSWTTNWWWRPLLICANSTVLPRLTVSVSLWLPCDRCWWVSGQQRRVPTSVRQHHGKLRVPVHRGLLSQRQPAYLHSPLWWWVSLFHSLVTDYWSEAEQTLRALIQSYSTLFVLVAKHLKKTKRNNHIALIFFLF